jgi:hypothetical protein
VEHRPETTPEQYLEQLGRLVAAGLDRETLEFAQSFEPHVNPELTPEQIDFVGGILEGSAMAVKMEEAIRSDRPA